MRASRLERAGSGRKSVWEGAAGRVSVASCLPAASQRASPPRSTTQISSQPNFTDCLSARVGSLSQNDTESYVYTPG
jgi:hypothetical protein